MKKIISMFLVSLLIFSILPLAFAQKETTNKDNIREEKEVKARAVKLGVEKTEQKLSSCLNILKNKPSELPENCKRLVKNIDVLSKKASNAEEFVKQLSEEDAKKFLTLPRAMQMKLLEKSKEESEKILGNLELKSVKKTDLFKKRVVPIARVLSSEKAFNLAKEEFNKISEIHKEKKQIFEEIKEKIKSCKDKDTEECKELRKQADENAKQFIISGAEKIIEHLNKLKTKIDSSEEINEEKAKEIVSEINLVIEKLEATIKEVENAKTKEEIKESAKKIHIIWKEFSSKERIHTFELVHSKVWNILKRSEHLEKRLENTLSKMKEKGIDISSLDQKVDEFSSKILSAKDKFTQAEEILKQARLLGSDQDSTKIKELIDKARDLLRQAHNEIKEAHKILQEIIKEIKSKGQEVEKETLESTDSKEEVVEVKEDSL